MITLRIDGKEITTEPGRTILEAAREGGIEIPTLCYHESLLPIGSCRLCVVEVEGYSEPMTACTTPAVDGISVTTKSEKLHRMRMEFLKLILVAHPLDCPQCDKGGECRVQDLVRDHGIESCEYESLREDRKGAYATPLIRYWERRCIVCGRCYRACREVSGRAAIDIEGRGFEARIAATDPADCISCGECLTLCPVGALTENMSPIKSRIWQSERVDTACPHCGFGCRLALNVCDGRVVSKVVGDAGLPPNFASLCVRGRFGYDFIAHPARLTEPWAAANGGKKTLAWEDAVNAAAENFRRLADGGKSLGFIVSPRATNEEMLAISRLAGLFKGARIASSAWYHTGRIAAAFKKAGIGFAGGYEGLSGCDLIVVAGADLTVNNHLLGNKVREAVLAGGARVVVVDPLPAALGRIADAHLRPVPGQDAALFDALSARLLKDGGSAPEAESLPGFAEFKGAVLAGAVLAAPGGAEEEQFEKAAGLIAAAKKVAVIFGSGISHREEGLAALLNLCILKGLPERGAIIPTALQANARGAAALIDGLAAPDELLADPAVAGVFIYEEDPFHFLNAEKTRVALAAREFVVACDILPTEATDCAGLGIPSTAFAEKEGSVVSGDGRTRTVARAYPGGPGGLEFLEGILVRLNGGRFGDAAGLKEELEKRLAAATEAPAGGKRFLAAFAAPAPAAAGRPYRLILRDIFASHYLAGKEGYAEGLDRVQKDALYVSIEDASALGVSDGDEVVLESADGAVTTPAAVKAGLRRGVLECLLYRKRGEILALSPKPAKVIEVAVRKA